MATADTIYADPSALIPLYLHQSRSREVVAWRLRIGGALRVTHHGRAELTNAIALAGFRGDIAPAKAAEAWAALDQDFLDGHLVQAPVAWRSAFNRAMELSREFSLRIGTRAADVLHIACAQELGLRHFLTFDERQRNLARSAGLKPLRI